MNKIKLYIFAIIITAAVFTTVLPVYAQFEEVTSKSFSLTYKRVEDFVDLSRALLSKKGKITISQKMNLFVINDYPANLAMVDSLLAKYDKPSRQILTIIHIITGENSREVEYSAPSDTSFLPLIKGLYSFNLYREIDKLYIRVEEGMMTYVDAAGGKYQIKFFVKGIGNELKFRTFDLSETASSIRGKYQKDILSIATNIQNGTKALFGAVGIGANRTMFVVVTARIL